MLRDVHPMPMKPFFRLFRCLFVRLLRTTFDVSCTGNGADGGAGINVYGGTPPYSYSLNGGPAMGVAAVT